MSLISQKTDEILEEYIRVINKYGKVSVEEFLAIRNAAVQELRLPSGNCLDRHMDSSERVSALSEEIPPHPLMEQMPRMNTKEGNIPPPVSSEPVRSVRDLPKRDMNRPEVEITGPVRSAPRSPMEVLATMKDQFN